MKIEDPTDVDQKARLSRNRVTRLADKRASLGVCSRPLKSSEAEWT